MVEPAPLGVVERTNRTMTMRCRVSVTGQDRYREGEHPECREGCEAVRDSVEDGRLTTANGIVEGLRQFSFQQGEMELVY